ncbi:MAG TPA: Hsp70 family protein, partial [Planctomycetaceae bacterium]|nr:Hsp70 family protein [Planctomycetaceae bacterium]
SISAIILAHLVREAEPQIGPIVEAVVTVPAYFTEKRRRATQQAGEIAGLTVPATLNEPVSAALAYGLHKEPRDQTVAVYDLGGGTFDVTIVRISPGELVELATLGNRQLGGKDWDDALVQFVADDFQKRFGKDPRASLEVRQALLIQCEHAKRRLSQMRKAPIKIHAFGQEHVCEVAREQFEQLTAGLVQTTKLTTEMALEDAGLAWSQVDRVVLIGGSTHMPMVREMLAQVSGQRPDTGINPVLAVALGAAQYGHLLEVGAAPRTLGAPRDEPDRAASPAPQPASRSAAPLVAATVRFVTAHGVGVKARMGRRHTNVVLINKNTRVPCSARQIFNTFSSTSDGCVRAVPVVVTQGDTSDLDLAEILYDGRIVGFPAGEQAGYPVEVTMEFDEQSRLHVRAVYLRTGRELAVHLDVPGGLQEEKVREYRKLLEESGLVRPQVAESLRDAQKAVPPREPQDRAAPRVPRARPVPPAVRFGPDEDDLPLLELAE